MPVSTIPLNSLLLDRKLSFRGYMHQAESIAEGYAEAMEEYGGWGKFPPLTVLELTESYSFVNSLDDLDRYKRPKKTTWPAGSLVLIGGYTRYRAAAIQKIDQAPAYIESGTIKDAYRLSWRENSEHGCPRRSDEIEAVIHSILFHHDGKRPSEREIAKLAGTSRGMVQRFLQKMDEARDAFERTQDAAKGADEKRKQDSDDDDVQPAIIIEQKAGETVATVVGGSLIRKDAWGRPLPEALHGLFEGAGSVSKDTRTIRTVALAIAAKKHGPDGTEACIEPALALADVREACAAIITGSLMIENHLPFIVCPKCDGKGRCLECSSLGAITKTQSLELSPEAERKARKFQGVGS